MAKWCTCDVEVCEMHTPKGTAMKAARDKYMTVEQADGTVYLDVDHNCEVSFEAGWKARDAIAGQPVPFEAFRALLEYAMAEEALYGEHWQITPESEQLAKQRRAALALCEGIG